MIRQSMRGLPTVIVALALAPTATAGVVAYPSSQTIPASGRLPPGGKTSISLAAARGEREGAWIVVQGASTVAASVSGSQLAPLQAALFFGHFVAFGARVVPDALLPWDGSPRPVEKPNQPLYVQVTVPDGTKPGTYRASVTVAADGRSTTLPLAIAVFDVQLPPPGAVDGNLLTSFHVEPESYVSKADELYHLGSNPARSAANAALYAFLAGYRIAPAGWGFGEPRTPAGYASSRKWWLDAAGNMVRESPASFSTLRIPISNQRAGPRSRIAGISPFAPESWCDYLHAVRDFWAEHGWLDGHLPYLYALDEPGPAQTKLVAAQASTAHRCFPGARVLVTANPDAANRSLWDGRGDDDVDIWAVLSRRYYGQFSHPHDRLDSIERAKRAGKTIWSSTYAGVEGTPGYTAGEPLSDPRMFLLWNALEGIRGTLYAEGITSYTAGNPLDAVAASGEFVLLYPGPSGPIASARLEQIRDGIEDWDVLDVVRRKRGLGAVRALLGRAGLFSASAAGVRLACTLGCDLHGPTKYAWPQWSHDASTPARIEQAHLAALELAAQ